MGGDITVTSELGKGSTFIFAVEAEVVDESRLNLIFITESQSRAAARTPSTRTSRVTSTTII